MATALVKLLLIQARAAVRRAGRGLRTARGAALAAVGGVIFVLWLVPVVFAAGSAPVVEPRLVREFAPAALLALTVASVLSAGDRAIFFTPAEVNFLFVAPFTRRQLLAYKLLKSAGGLLAAALAASLMMSRFSPFWPAAFAGALLSLLFVHLCSAAAGLLRRSVEVRADTPLRQAAAYASIIVLAGGAAAVAVHGARVVESASGVLQSQAARVVLAPVVPFARTFTADNPGDLARWGSLALLIDAALLAFVIRLDANFLEAAAAASERAYQEAQRRRQGDWMPGVKLTTSKRRVPPLPYAGGAGPTARRQLTALVRKSPKLLFVLVLALTSFVPVIFLGRRLPNVQGALIPAVGWLTLLLAGSLRFDFRGDIDQLPWIKSLPLRPLPLTLGQLAVPTASMALLHVVAFAAIGAFIEPLRGVALAAMVLAVPFDLLLIGTENLAFLLYPHRQGPPGAMGELGRQIVLFMVKSIAVGVVAGIAVAAGAIAYVFTRSLPVAVAVSALALGTQAAALVPLVAAAYRRFDPATDLPP